jgi:hypothetical protein
MSEDRVLSHTFKSGCFNTCTVIVIFFSDNVAANFNKSFVACLVERVAALPGSVSLNISKVLSQIFLYR